MTVTGHISYYIVQLLQNQIPKEILWHKIKMFYSTSLIPFLLSVFRDLSTRIELKLHLDFLFHLSFWLPTVPAGEHCPLRSLADQAPALPGTSVSVGRHLGNRWVCQTLLWSLHSQTLSWSDHCWLPRCPGCYQAAKFFDQTPFQYLWQKEQFKVLTETVTRPTS